LGCTGVEEFPLIYSYII